MSSSEDTKETKGADVMKSHHISDVDTWGNPDRNFYVYIVLSFLFGFLGFDHYYLRSYDTGFKKMLVNVLGLGFWYFWDLIQLMRDGKTIRKEGLNSPMDWIRGIGRGTFTMPPPPTAQEGGKPPSTFQSPKSYIVYTLLAVCFGWLGADQFYIGQTVRGFVKLLSVFNIFLFLFGLLWVAWDAFNAFFRTDSIMKEGITAPPPYSMFFGKIEAKPLFKVVEIKADQVEKEKPAGSWIPSFSIPWREIYRELVVPVIQPTVAPTVQKFQQGIKVGEKAVALGTSALAAGPALISNIKGQVEKAATMAAMPGSLAAAPGVIPGLPQGLPGAIPGLSQALPQTQGLSGAIPPQALPQTQGLSGAIPASSGNPAQARIGGSENDSVLEKINELAGMAEAARQGVQAMTGGGERRDREQGGAGPVIAGTLTALIIAGGAKGFYDFIAKQYG
jgi:TM2 domain-containing membrane protein YozV